MVFKRDKNNNETYPSTPSICLVVRPTYRRTSSVDSARCTQLKHVRNVRHRLPPAQQVTTDSPSFPLKSTLPYFLSPHSAETSAHVPNPEISESSYIFNSRHIHLKKKKKTSVLLILPPKFHLSPLFSPPLLPPLQFSSGAHDNFQIPVIAS